MGVHCGDAGGAECRDSELRKLGAKRKRAKEGYGNYWLPRGEVQIRRKPTEYQQIPGPPYKIPSMFFNASQR